MSSVMTAGSNDAYTIRLSKGAALIPETRLLLREWQPNDSAADLAERVLNQDLLGKATARRVRDIVQRVFARRFLSAENCPAKYLKTLLDRPNNGDWFRDLCLIYSARADLLIRDAVSVLLQRARGEGRISLSVDAVINFLRDAEQNGMMAKPWSEEVRKKTARSVLKVLTEFGFLNHRARGPREMRNFRPHPLAMAYLALDLHFRGATDQAVVADADWRLWSLDEPSVRDGLDDLNHLGLWVIQAAGAVVRITWKVSSMEEGINVLARCDI
jgi:hypothetical protein